MVDLNVGAVTGEGVTHCLFCCNSDTDYVEDVLEPDAVLRRCDSCGKLLLDRAEDFNDERGHMSPIERAEDEFAEMWT